jgi:DAK2 domain fusion protein YloV
VVAAEVMDGAVVRRWCRLAAEALGQTRSAIDALNVYPVPDADTGTNLYRTLRSAAQAVDELPEGAGHAAVWRAAADGAMLGACGNSGIIVSQLLRGLAEICAPASPCDGAVVARALGHAAGLARAAVSRPAEGTVLTVADAASRAALLLAGVAPGESAGAGLAAVVLAAAGAAREALGLTTGQLEALAASGVVDAGGAGLCVVLDAWAAAISGTPSRAFDVPQPSAVPAAVPGQPAEPGHATPCGHESPSAGGALATAAQAGAAGSYGYEVTYLLAAGSDAVAGLREQLDAMGDSLVIAGGGELWSVHVHVADAGAAIEAGLRSGRPRRITVTYLGGPPPAGHWVLAVCDTPGLAALAESAGARVLRADPDGPPDPARISAAVRGLGGRCIIVPNGSRAHAAATTAARGLRGEGIEVLVVDVSSAVQVLPALAVHEPAAEFGADAAAMGRAAARMRHASAGGAPIGAPGGGPAGGHVGGDPAGGVHADGGQAGGLERVVLAMTDELLAGGPELMTFLVGADAPAGLGELAVERVRAVSPETEVECHVGAATGAVVLAGAE